MNRKNTLKRLITVGLAISTLSIAQLGLARVSYAQGLPATCTVIEISGKLDSLKGKTAVVKGFTVDLSTLKADDDRLPEVGQYAKVEGCLKGDGSIEAGEFEWIARTRATEKIEIAGVVEEITATSIKIGGVIIMIDTAEIETVLAVGKFAKVEATKSGDTWKASEVEAATDDDVKRPENDDDDSDEDDDSNDDNGSDDDKDESDDDKGSDDDSNDDISGDDDDDTDDKGGGKIGGGDDDSNDDNGGGGNDDNGGGGDDDSNDDNGGSDDDSNDDDGGSDDDGDDD